MRIDWTKGKELEKAREEILAEVKRQIAEWGLKMPEETVLVLDFGLGDFYKIGLVEFWVANEREKGYCGKFLFLYEGQTCPAHYHRIKHETFFVVKGKVRMKTDREHLLQEGDVLVMKEGMMHSFKAEEGPALILEVSLPSLPEDSIFEDERIGVL